MSVAKDEDDIKQLIKLHGSLMWHINQAAILQEEGIHPKHRLIGYHEYFIEWINEGDTVLDIGCGYGAVSFSLARAGAAVTGIDIDHAAIEKAKRLFEHENVSFVSGDIRNTKIGGHYDVIVLSNVLEHIEERIRVLKQVQHQYTPNKLILRVPMVNRHWLVSYKKELGIPYFSDPTHFTEYTYETFVEEIHNAGLKIKDLRINWGEIWAVLVADNNSLSVSDFSSGKLK